MICTATIQNEIFTITGTIVEEYHIVCHDAMTMANDINVRREKKESLIWRHGPRDFMFPSNITKFEKHVCAQLFRRPFNVHTATHPCAEIYI